MKNVEDRLEGNFRGNRQRRIEKPMEGSESAVDVQGYQPKDYLTPVDLLMGENIEDYLDKRRKMLPGDLTQPVNSLARFEDSADFSVPGSKGRILVYPENPADDKAFAALTKADIPQFPREIVPNPDLTVVKIPLNSWRLDSTDFQEQEPTFPAGNGAIEIMNKLGLLLGKIYAKTGTLPVNFELNQIAYVTGDNEFIKLVPPYTLSANVNPEELIKRVEKDLNDIDPTNLHDNQIKALRASLFRKVQ